MRRQNSPAGSAIIAEIGLRRSLPRSYTLTVFPALLLASVASLYPQDDPSTRGASERDGAYYDHERFDRGASAGLFIGVREFFDGEGNRSQTIYEVPYAVDDAVDLAHLFASDLGLIDPERITLALSGDPQKPGSQERLRELRQAGATVRSATAFTLLDLLKEIPRQAGPGGLLVVSAATHGFDEGGLSWLLAADSRRTNLSRTSVSSADLLEHVGRSPAPRRIVFLDACREQVGGEESRGLGANPVSAQLSEEIGNSVGLAVLMAATANGFSYDDHTRKNGVFTAAIIDALQGAAAIDHRGFITLETARDFANERVQQWVRDNRPEHIGRSQGVTGSFEGDAGGIPLREDDRVRRQVQATLATHADLLRFLVAQEPPLPEITLKMVQVVEEDLDRLPFAESNRLASALEAFAAGGAEGAAARATQFERFFAEWLEVRPPLTQVRTAARPEEAQTPPGRGPTGAEAPLEQATREILDEPAEYRTATTNALAAPTVLVLIDGEEQSGSETAEGVVLEELAKRGHEVLDQTSLEIGARTGVVADPAELGRMGQAAGAAVLVLGMIRSDATSSVGGFYTGSSRLTVRTYDTATGELLSSETFQVGADNVPGKRGATPAAAVTEAARQVGYRAAVAVSRKLKGPSGGS